ncbi:class I SAM-dependent methyltransferase [Mycolicibacterium sp. CBM1]
MPVSMMARVKVLARGIEPALHDRREFLLGLPEHAEIFDVGCGNDCAYITKSIRPDSRYVGLDVGDYFNDHEPTAFADEYVVVTPGAFTDAIEQRAGKFDAVISSHNLEHCYDPDGVTTAMARALRPGGQIYLAFPSAASLSLPKRGGCLNFFDDSTHVRPPDYHRVLELLREGGVQIDYAAERHRPPSRVAMGLMVEPISRRRNHVMRGTWALYGFETVIWGTKIA